MGKMKALRKQMKKQLREFEEQIETLGEQADAIEIATLNQSQERLVNLLDAIYAQLKLWQNGMTEKTSKLNGNKSNSGKVNLNAEALTLWNSMETQVEQWLATAATIRMETGADGLWQLATLRNLDVAVNEKLRILKDSHNGSRTGLKDEVEYALDDLKYALERALSESSVFNNAKPVEETEQK